MKKILSFAILLSFLGGIFLSPSRLSAQVPESAPTNSEGPFAGTQGELAKSLLFAFKSAAGQFHSTGFSTVVDMATLAFLGSVTGSNSNFTLLGNGQGLGVFINSLKTQTPAQLNNLFTHGIFGKSSGNTTIPESNPSNNDE